MAEHDGPTTDDDMHSTSPTQQTVDDAVKMSPALLENFSRWCDKEKKNQCDVCNRRFKAKDKLIEHITHKHILKQAKYTCTMCNAKYSGKNCQTFIGEPFPAAMYF